LRNEQFNDEWKLSYSNQARAQDANVVLDATYSPSSPIDVALFQEKQKYRYAILDAQVETTKGKSFIQKYKSRYDAHKFELTAPQDADNPTDPPDYTTKITTKCDHDFDKLCPFFRWLNTYFI
jgi:hypothetical protein